MNFLRPKSAFLSFALAIPLSLQVFAQTPQPTGPSPEMQKANALYQAQKWDEAVTAFETVTKAEPKNGMAWFRLGYAHHSLGHFDKAVDAYLQSVALGNNPTLMYNLACAYSRLKNNDKAFEWLNKAVAGGYTQFQQMKTDLDLEGVRADARFAELEKNIDRTAF